FDPARRATSRQGGAHFTRCLAVGMACHAEHNGRATFGPRAGRRRAHGRCRSGHYAAPPWATCLLSLWRRDCAVSELSTVLAALPRTCAATNASTSARR